MKNDVDAPVASHPGEIIVIDDTPANLHILTNLLGNQGYQVRPFPSGKLALAGLEHCQPDLILLDIQMPHMDGYEVCKILKSQDNTRDVPVVFISALSDAGDKVKAFALGGIDYLTKPFYTEEVLVRVASHIELFRLRQPLQHQTFAQARQLATQNQKLRQINQELHQQCQLVKETQLQLIQTEKMAALGSLLAGVAHEINNPLGFIQTNLKYAQDYTTELLEILCSLEASDLPPTHPLRDRLDELDAEFIAQDLPKLLASMKKGVETLGEISNSLRIFSRTENHQQKSTFDIHTGLDSTLLMLRYRLKANPERPEIQVIKDYGDIPALDCYPGKLNQVFMNILANAIDAFEDKNRGLSYRAIEAQPNQIILRTSLLDAQWVSIDILDNGPGMTESVKTRICEQGFTTKIAGKGTGLGMAIARQIIETDHGGRLQVESTEGQGSRFLILLPR